jgi:hypothetical protein
MAKYLPRISYSSLIKNGVEQEGEKQFINRLLCMDGILDREHQDFLNLSESDQIFYRELRDALHKEEEFIY